MSWIRESSLNIIQNFCLHVIKQGNVPEHVAFIMDGNRRYATRNKVNKIDGHTKGFDKLTETLKWCLDLGVKEVTVYAFSIENFKRSQDEVDNLMDLAREKFRNLLNEKEKLMSEGINIRVLGDLSLLPDDLKRLIAEAVIITRNNKKARLNVAFAYTGRNEITCAVKNIIVGNKEQNIRLDDINESLVENCLYTEGSSAPELLIRTSGEVRLSDFMLWQTSHSCIYFTTVLWPDFTIWELLKAVFYYQRSKSVLQKDTELNRNKLTENGKHFASFLSQQRHELLQASLQSFN